MKLASQRKRLSAIRRRRPPGGGRWHGVTDEELLDTRLCDLNVQITGTRLERPIHRLHDELEDRNISFRPRCWLSEEWFAPEDIPGIAIPFYMADDRLKQLELAQMYEVEGGTELWCMQLLRHEAGHSIDTAYRLSLRRRWRELFGRATKRYPEYYRPRPTSRESVLHLDWWYSHSHPTEDFAETFAVWLDPDSNWREFYRDWPALEKLEYLDGLMEEIGRGAPQVATRGTVDPVSQLTVTLREHYRAKQRHYLSPDRDVHDGPLKWLFAHGADDPGAPPAADWVFQMRSTVCDVVAEGDPRRAYAATAALREIKRRCRELDLRAVEPDQELEAGLVALTERILEEIITTEYLVPV